MIYLLAAALSTAAPVAGLPPHGSSACPDNSTPDALVCRGLAAEKSGNHEAAAQAFEDAGRASSDKDPRTARIYAAAGNLWIAANEPAKAALDLDRALALPGLEAAQRGEAFLDRARAAEEQDDLKTARARLNDASATISNDPFYWYFSSALAIRENDMTTALSAITKALTLAPSDPTVLFEAGHVADMMGDDDKARDFWMRAAGNDPKGEIGKAAAKAVEMLGVTPTVKTDPAPPK